MGINVKSYSWVHKINSTGTGLGKYDYTTIYAKRMQEF